MTQCLVWFVLQQFIATKISALPKATKVLTVADVKRAPPGFNPETVPGTVGMIRARLTSSTCYRRSIPACILCVLLLPRYTIAV